ncbi:unnamed protein product [Polarella glacialis]|uniref:Guanylate-binding protein N-terminal domain-containing protein n=1 Tax=Polarella glacialis TaxID=89957 RepID=A0A813KX15_POLGL|nr:unnamed protein product [Polarella glacialis]
MGLRAPYAGGFGVGHGQQTHTRGINICAEQLPDGKGTIIWMDTEGLFSSEDARSSYGPKIFSLALLFSSTVLLNNVKVLNDQFFAFFAEQQQVARVLRQGLQAEGLPEGTLLPGNLSVVWVLQQPISYDATSATSRSQLEAFLGLPGDETRERVQRGFRHLIQEVPAAANDFRLWSKLDQLEDEQLLLEYVDAASMLRSLVLRELASARPMQAASVATQLRMYVELVQNEHFSGALAKEAFEESEIARLCGGFANAAEELAGEMPSTSFPEAFVTSQEDLDSKKKDVVENFHLGAASWLQLVLFFILL